MNNTGHSAWTMLLYGDRLSDDLSDSHSTPRDKGLLLAALPGQAYGDNDRKGEGLEGPQRVHGAQCLRVLCVRVCSLSRQPITTASEL